MITYGAAVLSALAGLVTTQPRRVLVGAVVFLAICAGFGAPVTGKLSVDPDIDFIDPHSESNLTGKRLRAATGRGLSPAILVLVASDGPVRSAAGLPTDASRRSRPTSTRPRSR